MTHSFAEKFKIIWAKNRRKFLYLKVICGEKGDDDFFQGHGEFAENNLQSLDSFIIRPVRSSLANPRVRSRSSV